ncbi:MAG TPA: TIGR03621 family F420-dependent LLM class oxidoreductase [Chloroflexota bacterium]
MPRHPFRFAIGTNGLKQRAPLMDHVRTAESMGYSTVLVADHLLDQLAPLLALSAIAQATARMRIGTFVLNNDLRHPALLAQELATLDLLSDGRLDIGLGAGWNVPEYTAAGLDFDAHPVRFKRMSESLRILKGLFGEGAVTFDGTHYRITEMEGLPKPAQRPHPPIMIGGGGKRMLQFAAREAQIVGLAPRLPSPANADIRSVLADATLEKVSWVREAAGDRFSELELNTYPCLGPIQVTDDPRAAAGELSGRLKERYGTELTEDELLDSPHVFYGTVEQLVDKIKGLRERFGISYVLVLGDMHAFAPVVERLAGT